MRFAASSGSVQDRNPGAATRPGPFFERNEVKSNIVMIVAISAGQLLFAGGALAAVAQSDQSKLAKSIGAPSARASTRKKVHARIKPVDINSASKTELMKLPGLSAADAQRIIAGRPYLSKANLVTHKIISEAQYDAIQSMIWARQKGLPLPKPAARK